VLGGRVVDKQQKLLSRLCGPEDNYTERKPEGAGTDDFRRTLIAFANSVPHDATAILFIGVDDRGLVRGVSNPDSLQKTIRDICEQKCSPRIEATMVVLSVDTEAGPRQILAVEIGPSTKGPHFAGPAYIRTGSESVKVPDNAYEELFARRCGKARQLLEWKNQIVSVVVRGKKLGSTQRLNDSAYRAQLECRITECTPHYVRFLRNGYESHAEPLENVCISWDEERYRPLLIIEEK